MANEEKPVLGGLHARQRDAIRQQQGFLGLGGMMGAAQSQTAFARQQDVRDILGRYFGRGASDDALDAMRRSMNMPPLNDPPKPFPKTFRQELRDELRAYLRGALQ